MQIETSTITPYGKIYRLTNKINGKMYHGQTTEEDVKNRWDRYKGLHCKGQPKLYNALKKYGWDNFLAEVVDITSQDQTQLDNLEIFYIAKFDSMNNGYNSTPGGKGIGKGHIVSEETKQKISNANIGKVFSEETRRKLSMAKQGIKNPMFGKLPPNIGEHHSEETKNKMRGRLVSKETRRKMSEIKMGKLNHQFGKHHSDETKQRISENNKGKNVSKETREKISSSLKDHITSIATRQKMSESRSGKKHYMFGRKHSEETKRKMSEAARNRKKLKLIPVDYHI